MSQQREQPSRTVWFHRQYRRMQGGHLVHAHYYADTARLPGFEAKISFSRDAKADSDAATQTATLWPQTIGTWTEQWCPAEADILFLAGQDWQYLLDSGLETLNNPRLNLIQHVRHGDPDHPLHGYLNYKAIRICVSAEVANAISIPPGPNGPVVVIPNGCDLSTPANPFQHRGASDTPVVTIVGYKNPELAAAVARLFDNKQIPYTLMDRFVPRQDFVRQLSASDIALCIPRKEEGFYLPALEAMNLGCLVVTADCIGNRSFCLHEENCLVANYNAESFCDATLRALSLDSVRKQQFLATAQSTALAHSLESQRTGYYEVLSNIDQLW